MAFLAGQGYGNFFAYDVAAIRGDGFEVKTLAGTIMRQAFGELVFTRALNESRDAFGVGKGGTFTVPIAQDFGAPATVAPLTSGTVIGLGTQKMSSVQFSMYEYGTGLGYEGLGDWITNLDMRSELVNSLGRHIGRMINWLDYDILVNTPFSVEVRAFGSYTNLLGTNRQLVATSYGELGPGGLALVYDTFKKSLASPITDRGMFILFGNAASLRNLKQGSFFQNGQLFNQFSSPKLQILGEFGGFLGVETEELLGKGTLIAVAANAGGYGFGKTPTTFYYPDFGSDAGRLQVWKTLFYRGQGPIWRNSGTAAIVIRANSAGYNYGALD